MSFSGLSHRALRTLAVLFLSSTVLLGAALAASWIYIGRLALQPLRVEAPPQPRTAADNTPVSPLLLRYQVTVPGRGEIFPALSAGGPTDYWPLALLSITNNSDRPVLQTVSARVPGWSPLQSETVVIGPRETRMLRLSPELLPNAYSNQEIRQATLQIRVSTAEGETVFAQDRPVYLHSSYDLYWGKKFANAQFLARWVTPHDPAVLRLIAEARRNVPYGRLQGYNMSHPNSLAIAAQARLQAKAVFAAMRHSGLSYVSSLYTFGNFTADAQRIRLPHETLALNNANCIDVSVAFASAMENLGMKPVVVIVPGHAFTGVRLGPDSQETLYLDLTVLPHGTFRAAVARADNWLKKTPPGQVITVDVSAARMLNIYPMPTSPATPSSQEAL